MSQPVIDPSVMRRLAFIRQLFQQGITQSGLPEPLNATAVLSVHDASELLLVVIADQLKASLPKHTTFMDYWRQLEPSRFAGGVVLPARQRMERLNELRNGLKHNGVMPSIPAVNDACADARSFLEDATLLVFGMTFEAIDMAEVIPQAPVRDKVRAATTAETAGNRNEAMGLLVEAYESLFRIEPGQQPRLGQPGGRALSTTMSEREIRATLVQPPDSQIRRPAGATPDRLGRQIGQVTEIAQATQRAVRVMALGTDYWQFDRFEKLTPTRVYYIDGHVEVREPPGYAPSQEEFGFCRQFIISAALRMAEAEAHEVPPSWTSKQP